MKIFIKKVFCIILAVLILSLCGCNKPTENDKIDHTEKSVTLENVSNANLIQFDGIHVEICIYSDENYYFSNRNKDFYEKFIAFLKDTEFVSQQVERTDSKNFYISIYDGENSASFSIYETDIIRVVNSTASGSYYCEGVYKKFVDTFGIFLSENQKYCRSASTLIRGMNEFAIFDKNNYVLASDYISRTPYLFYDSGIVHLWVQTGTGSLSRWAKFFDVKNGLVSPDYYGQTDYFGDMVCSTGHSAVILYEMFSGEQICIWDKFEKPLGDCLENIQSAYFSEDGSQIIVEYLNADFETELQIFDTPQN